MRTAVSAADFVLENLKETGRLQFFYHSPSSALPIRDYLNEQGEGHKREPHIEKEAENWCVKCNQPNIVGFLKRRERYLFLLTTCRRKQLKQFYGKRFIVGYIVKDKPVWRGGWWAIQGPTKLFSFADSCPLEQVPGLPKGAQLRSARLDLEQTKVILRHLEGKRSILKECVAELKAEAAACG